MLSVSLKVKQNQQSFYAVNKTPLLCIQIEYDHRQHKNLLRFFGRKNAQLFDFKSEGLQHIYNLGIQNNRHV
jgi:hypothetical protein